MPERLFHDVGLALAHALLDIVARDYSEERQRELFAAFYNASRAGLEALCVQADRVAKQIAPSNG